MSQLIYGLLYGTANISDNIALNCSTCRMKVTGNLLTPKMHQKSKHHEGQSTLNTSKYSWETMYGYTVGTFRSFSNYSLISARYLSQWRSMQLDYLREIIPALSVLLSWMYFQSPSQIFPNMSYNLWHAHQQRMICNIIHKTCKSFHCISSMYCSTRNTVSHGRC
jgi:hypothetical protein